MFCRGELARATGKRRYRLTAGFHGRLVGSRVCRPGNAETSAAPGGHDASKGSGEAVCPELESDAVPVSVQLLQGSRSKSKTETRASYICGLDYLLLFHSRTNAW